MAKPVVSGPLKGSHTVTGYQAVPGSAIPPLNIWLKDTAAGNAPRDHILKLLDESVGKYYTCIKHWDKLAVLGRLYFQVNGWLDFAKANKNPATTAREPLVYNLFLAVVDRLCFRFDCSVNVLPQKLEECWGRVLTPHGHEIDTKHAAIGALPEVADYLDRAQAEKFRLIFINGRVSQRTWWKEPPDDARCELAESSRVGWEWDPKVVARRAREGKQPYGPMMDDRYAGFAMSMSRQIYMAHHKGRFVEHNFFHSSYLSGDTVLCTGTMLIERGVVLGIRNDSGHYQPTLEHLLNVVEALQMYGFSPARIDVTAVAESWTYDNGNKGDFDITISGQELIRLRGGGGGLQRRIAANKANIQKRGGLQLLHIVP